MVPNGGCTNEDSCFPYFAENKVFDRRCRLARFCLAFAVQSAKSSGQNQLTVTRRTKKGKEIRVKSSGEVVLVEMQLSTERVVTGGHEKAKQKAAAKFTW